MARGGGLRYYVDADTTGLRTGLTEAEGLFGRFGKVGGGAFRGLAAAATPLAAVMGAGMLGGAIVESVRNASDLNEQVSKAGVVFRQSSAEVKAFASTTAASLGISKRSALEAAGTFGNMLVPMGIARGKAADMSVAMVKLAADLASFNNADPSEVLEALRSGLSGETEPMRKFGVFLSDATLKQEALNLGLSDGKENLNAQQKALATYSVMMKQTKDAQGDFARTQDGLANGQRRFRAQLEDTSAAIGTAFLPPLTKALAAVNRDVMPKMQSAANAIGAVWESPELDFEQKWTRSWTIIERTGVPEQAKQAVYDGLVEVGTHGPRILLTAMAEAPWPAKAILGGVLLAKFAPALSLLGPALGKAVGAGGAGGIAGGLGGKAGVVPVFVTNGGGAGGGVPWLDGGGKGGAGGLRGTFGKAGVGKLGFGAAGVGGPLGIAAGAVLGGMALDSFASGGGLEGTPAERLFPSDRQNQEATRKFYDSMIRAYRGGMPRWREFLASDEGTLYRFQGAEAQVKDAMATFSKALEQAGPKVKRSAQGVSKLAVNALADLQPGARAVAQDAMVRMTAQLEASGKAPKGSTKALVGALVKEFGRLPDSTRAAARSSIAYLNGIGAALDSLGGKITSTASKLAALARQMQTPPDPAWRFARGGTVPGPLGAGDVVPAMLSPGEVVLTRDMIRDLGPGAVFATVAARGGRLGGDGLRFAKGGYVPILPTSRGGSAFMVQDAEGAPGPGGRRYHAALDWFASGGTKVVSPVDGRVVEVKASRGNSGQVFGGVVKVAGGGRVFVMRHVDPSIKLGANVSAGDVVARVTDWRDGSDHVHLEVWRTLGGGYNVSNMVDPGSLDWSGKPGQTTTGGRGGRGGGSSSTGMTLAQAQRADRGLMAGGRATAPGLTEIRSIDRRHADDDLQRARAEAAGLPESQILKQQKKELEADAADIRDQINRLNIRRNQLKNRRATLRKEMLDRKTGKVRRAAIADAIRNINDEMTQLADAIISLNGELEDVMRQMVMLGISIDQATAAATGSSGSSGGDSLPSVIAGPGTLDAEFVRTILGSPDIGTGGRTALDAAAGGGVTVVVNLQSLTPGTPADAQRVAASVTSALGSQGSVPAAVVPSGA